MHKPARTERLTDASVARIPLATDGQHVVRDALCPGLFVVVGKRAKTWTVQGDLRRGTHRETIKMALGRTDELPVSEARRLGAEALTRIRRGEDPRAAARQEVLTLRVAMEAYCKVMARRGRSGRSIALVRDLCGRVMASWADLPLADLGRDRRRVVARHDEITSEAGPYAANHAMRALRAVYNEAMRVDPDLPPNPVRAVTFNTERRRDTGMGPDDLPAWWAQLQELGNPIRRELHLMTLLTGSRPEALRTARWEHIDVRRRVLHIPRPKGGERRAFDIPLSRAMVLSLVRVRRAGMVLHARQSAEWVFPADSVTGHIVEHKEDRAKLAKWGGDLRQTFRNMCALAGIDPLTSRLLMNHVVDWDVHDGYITKAALMGSLRVHQQRLSTFIMDALRREPRNAAEATPALPAREARKPVAKTSRVAPSRVAAASRKALPLEARA
jgi:integrase